MPKVIHMAGSSSTSESLRVALEFAKTNDPNKHSVLFVFCIQNYFRFNGFRMNSAQFTAHPDEREVLLGEGARVIVMGVDEVYINNELTGDSFWDDFNQKTMTVVYLLHPE